MTTQTTAPKYRTITLTDRVPVRIREDLWPQIAHGNWGDNAAIPSQSNRGCDIRVRQHADGRAIVYATSWSQWQGARGWSGGELLAPGDDIPAAIRRVGSELNEVAVRECIADLPAERLDTAYTWSTDAASGEIEAADPDGAVRALVQQGEWAAVDSAREQRDIADGAWLTIFEDGLPVFERGTMP